MIVRPPTRGELERAAEIAKIAFEDDSIDTWINSYNWIADNRGLDHLIVVEDDGKLIASMLCTPGDARFGDDILPLCAVGGVATLPEHRKHGAAGEMMKHSVRILRDKGYHTSALWPFSYHYYRKFGWELASELRRYTLPSKLASELASPEGTRPALESDLPGISEVIDRFGRRYNCVTIRDDLWWDCIRHTYDVACDGEAGPNARHCPLVHETDGKIDGYAFFTQPRANEEPHLKSRELITDTPEARRALLSWLGQVGAEDISFYAPPDDGFLQELADPRAVTTLMESGFMFRVVDPLAAMELRSYDPAVRGSIAFAIADPVLGQVEFSLDIQCGGASRAKSPSSQRLNMDVQTFSQVFSGYLRPERALALGKVEASSQDALEFAERLFPDVMPFRSMVEIG